MDEQNKKPFYQSCAFWVGLAAIVIVIGDVFGLLLPAWQAAKEKQERDRAAEQAGQK